MQFFKLSAQKNQDEINKLILTASGGPFRNSSLDDLRNVSIEDA